MIFKLLVNWYPNLVRQEWEFIEHFEAKDYEDADRYVRETHGFRFHPGTWKIEEEKVVA